MKHLVTFLLLFLSFCGVTSAQKEAREILTPKDKEQLKAVSGFQISDIQLNTPIPAVINNANSYYMPYVFYQEEYSCAQASSLTYLFTYELAVRRNRFVLFDTPYEKYHIPSHFAWNFYNNSTSDRGVSFMDTWHLIKTAGSPFTPDWGTTYFGGASKWMSGYNKYYEGMKNRIVEMIAFPTNTEIGIHTLRHWIANHGVNDPMGGCVNIFCSSNAPYLTLPFGTPEAGKYLFTNYGAPTHSVTIVGYNDSIRYDFNNDGAYTNHIDITGDGIVDIHDWEIGGVLVCNSHGEEWANNGFAYVPYKVLSSTTEENGIWNACAYGVQVRDEVFPQITYKATIKHNRRNMIKISAGISANLNDSIPQKIIDFGVFNYQGGPYYMQGNAQEFHKVLEFGLDVTPFLNDMTPNTPYKFFLIVDEKDPNGLGVGEIVNFSLMDYTASNVVETSSTQSGVPINNNSVTRLSVVRAINFTKPEIQQNIINITFNQSFAEQLTALQGKTPYRWQFSNDYQVEEFTQDFPNVSANSISFTSSDYGKVKIELPFNFPFFDGLYQSIYLSADGYIAFRNEKLPWPYLCSTENQFRATRQMAPFYADLLVSSVKTDSDEHSFSISYTGKIKNESNNSVKFVVKLYDSGIIEYYYGNMSYFSVDFKSGIARGDDENFYLTDISGIASPLCSNRNFRFTPPPRIPDLSLSRTGLLTGNLNYLADNIPFSVSCFDNNEVKHTKTLYLNCTGVGVQENMTIQLQAFPNPTNDKVELSTNNIFIDFIEICGINGALILHQSVLDTHINIDLSNYASGLYICKVYTQDGISKHIKLMKQ